jgi:hypothetical protein
MHTEPRPLITWISSVAAICLTIASLSVTSCERPSGFDSSAPTTPTSANDATASKSILVADPNPVMSGSPDGTTTITWDTGSNVLGDVYVVAVEQKEKLFATSIKGSQEAAWIKPGSTGFRLYTQADHKFLAQVIVTMPPPSVSRSSGSATPPSSTSP